jgi:MFS family permease
MMRRRLKASKMSNPTPPDGAAVARHDPYAALRIPEFRKYLAGNFLSLLGIQMQTFAVSWEIYERTDSKMALAWVGLVQIVPVIGLFLQAGRAADIFDRRKIMIAALTLLAVCSLSLSAVSAHGGSRDVALFRWESSPGNVLSISEYDADTLAIYVVLLLVGTARSFFQPARSAYLPQIVPREVFSNAVTWNSSGFQLATVTGPAVGGFLVWAFDEKAAPVYLLTAALIFIFIGLLTTIASRPRPVSIEPASFRSLAAGLSFVWRTRVMFGAIVLDMFAVLRQGYSYRRSAGAGLDACGPGNRGAGDVGRAGVPPADGTGRPVAAVVGGRFRSGDDSLRLLPVLRVLGGHAAVDRRAGHDQRGHQAYARATADPRRDAGPRLCGERDVHRGFQ